MYLGLRRFLGNEAPLHAGREAGAAAPAQIRLFHFVDDLLGRHLRERFFEGLIAFVLLDRHRCCGNFRCQSGWLITGTSVGQARVHRAGGAGHRSEACCRLEARREAASTLSRSEIFVEVVIDLDGGRAGAGADAFDFFEGKDAVWEWFPCCRCAGAFLSMFVKFVAAAQHAGDVGADLDVIAPSGLAAQHGVVGERFSDLDDVQVERLAISSRISSPRNPSDPARRSSWESARSA